MQQEDGLWRLWGRDVRSEATDVLLDLGAFDAVVMCDAMTANAGGLLFRHFSPRKSSLPLLLYCMCITM